MKNKIIILIFISIIALFNDKSFSFTNDNSDVFNKMIESVHGNIIEYGIRANFEINEDGEKYCLDLLKKLNLTNNNINITKNNKFYSLEFSNTVENGYIEYSSYDNHNVVTVNIVKSDNVNNLEEFKTKIDLAINNTKDVKYFQYLKAKVLESDKVKLDNEIIDVLKAEKAKNTSTVELENGISTVTYTKRFNAMKNNGKLVDLNFALCSYPSGNYLIIGTPIIIEAY